MWISLKTHRAYARGPAAWRVRRNPMHHDLLRACCLMRLIKPAVHNAGILRMVVLRHYGADLPGRRHRRRLHSGSFPRAILRHCFRWRRFRLSLAMRDELGIAGRTRPWRHTIGQAASPMRPMIGDKAAAACEIKPKPEHNCRFNEPLMGHIRCRISRLTQVSLPKPDSGWAAFVARLWSQQRMRFARFLPRRAKALSPLIVGLAVAAV
jgi:hypothetical protein